MRSCLPLLAVLCASLVRGDAAAANYRFHALANLDGDAQTGCLVAAGSDLPGGHELRVVALADRAQVAEAVLESCRDGNWQPVAREVLAQPIAAGQGLDGADRVAWSVPRSWLVADARLSLHMLAERADIEVRDALANGSHWQALELVLGDPLRPVPTFGFAALLLMAAALACFGLRRLRPERARAWIWPLVVVVLLGQAMPQRPARAAMADGGEAVDAGNDVADAGADILQARVDADGERIHFVVDVNDIEGAGLADKSRVLFIGNSLTYSNDMPLMLEAIAAQAGRTLDSDMIAVPNAALEDHFRARTAHAALANGGYQIVIMQQGPSSLPESQANLREWTIRFAARIRAGGARPALYMVWPDITRAAFFDDVRNSYLNAALEVDGMFIPAGEAWRAAWRVDPALPLYDADQFHPSVLGSYAAALSMFAELYRQSPVGLPSRLQLPGGQELEFDPAQARAVQVAAWAAHRQHGRAGR